MGSRRAAKSARGVFDLILRARFRQFDPQVGHESAHDNRYSKFDLKAELTSLLYCPK